MASFNHDSKHKRGKRYVQGGRHAVRSVLYMATLAAIRHNPTIKVFYDHLLAAGKEKKLIVVVCMCKLLIIFKVMI